MKLRPTTRAAEGLPRRAFTVEEVELMVAIGLMDEHERVELLGGDLVPMAAKGYAHESLKIALNQQLMLGRAERFRVIPATTFRLPTTRSSSRTSSSFLLPFRCATCEEQTPRS